MTDRNLIGAFIKSYEGKTEKLKITETSGEVTIGQVIGYTRGGYLYGDNREMKKATALIKAENGSGEPPSLYSISVEDVESAETVKE